jgi:hypothetical protein
MLAMIVAACSVAAGCDADGPKPDMVLAREIREGSQAACVRSAGWIEGRMRGVVWSRTDAAVQVEPEVNMVVDAPRLVGVTPGDAVYCDVRITIGEGASAVTERQPYMIALGWEGPDFARIVFTAAGALPAYAAARTAALKGQVEWNPDFLPCSQQRPGVTSLQSATVQEARDVAAALVQRATTERVVLPEWALTRVRSITQLGQMSNGDEISKFGAVCGPLGCDQQAFGFVVQDRRWNEKRQVWEAGGIPTGVLRIRSDSSEPYVYQPFGHGWTRYETCAFEALDEVKAL